MRVWLKKMRTDKRMTQEQFAKHLNIPPTTFAAYEQGIRNPTVRQAKRISRKLGVEWTIFFDTELHETYRKEHAK